MYLTQKRRFYYIADVYEPQLTPVQTPNFNEPPGAWVALSPKYSDSKNLEIHLAHSSDGLIVLSDKDVPREYYTQNWGADNKNRRLRHFSLIAKSPYKNEYMAFFTKEANCYIIRVLSNNFNGTTNEEVIVPVEKQPGQEDIDTPISMVWCSSDWPILIFPIYAIVVGPGTFAKRTLPKTGFYCKSEQDGLRVIAKNSQYFMRLIPEEYLNVFQPLNNPPAKQLLDIYQSFEGKAPFQENDIRNKKQELITAVQDCIIAGSFDINVDIQKLALSAAQYGKTFLNANQIDHNKFYEVCTYLRVLYNITQEPTAKISRIMTYQQLKNIDEEIMVHILLRYNLHHLAHQVCTKLNYKKKSELITLIYQHWAVQMVQLEGSDTQIADRIKTKLSECASCCYADIAERAFLQGKLNLADELLKEETQTHKKVPLQLNMASKIPSVEFVSAAAGLAPASLLVPCVLRVLVSLLLAPCSLFGLTPPRSRGPRTSTSKTL